MNERIYSIGGGHVCPTIVSMISKGPGNTQDVLCVAHVSGGIDVGVSQPVYSGQGQLRSGDTECMKRPTTR